jgi:hypothetical protein
MKCSLRSLIPSRRWYQFGLRSLLAVVFVLAVASAWYGYRLRLIEHERSRLAGLWYVSIDDLLVTAFDIDNERIGLLIPNNGVGRINFQIPGPGGGLSLGIYRCDGEKMTVAQAEPGQPRPTSFEKVRGVSIWTGARSVSPEERGLLVKRMPSNWEFRSRVTLPTSQATAPNQPKNQSGPHPGP